MSKPVRKPNVAPAPPNLVAPVLSVIRQIEGAKQAIRQSETSGRGQVSHPEGS
jgi:hypothetical protein